jgi:DNA-binding transcriptional regulator YiaG
LGLQDPFTFIARVCIVARAVLTDVGRSETSNKGGGMPDDRLQPGSAISDLRRSLNMTQEEFAHAIGVTVSTVNRWENGHIEPSRLARKAMEALAAQRPASSDFAETPAAFSAKAS